MKLSRLRLLGFKSFVEPTEFHVEPGLTGIVGPNGCGKSNLVEALRWVMGEASYKNMRASGMDEVIFSGSGNRPARNMAEVTLVVDNSERKAPAAFNDSDMLEVTRRIEREAGSVYRVNGREVRARDVQLLFADASTGAHSPAMVGQGRIGELIAAKPTARRALLEEAAGVSGLHSRRHEAELRLKGAEQNLERIDDVVAEIEAQFENLKRQARQAVRYKTLSAEIRKAEAASLYLRFAAAEVSVGEANQTLNETNALVGGRSETQARAARNQAVAAAGLPALREAYAAAAAGLQRIVLEGQTLDAEEKRIKDRIEELNGRIAQYAADIERERRIAAEQRDIIAKLDREEKTLRAEDANTGEREAEAAAARDAAETRLAESERLAATATAELAELNAGRGQLSRSFEESSTRRGRLAEEIDGVESELRRLTGATGASDRLTNARSAVEAAGGGVTAAEAAALAAEKRLVIARESEAAARPAFSEAERKLARVDAETDALRATLSRSVGGDFAPIIDSVQVPAGLERALAAAFGDELDAPTDAAASVHWLRIDPAPDDAALPAGAAALGDMVIAPAELTRRLRQVGLVDAATGARIQASLRPGQLLVSRAGDLWRWDGYVAAADAPTAAAERLANRNRLSELEGERRDLAAELARTRAVLEEAGAEARDAAEAERISRESSRTKRAQLDAARSALSDIEREVNRNAARVAALQEAKTRLSADLAEAQSSRGAAETALAAMADPAALEARLAEYRAGVASNRAALADARSTFDAVQREAEIRGRRLATIADERRSWNERATGAARQIETLDARRLEAEQDRTALADQPQQIARKRMALLDAMATAEAGRQGAADGLATAESALAEADRAASHALAELSEAREQRGRAEERLAGAHERLAEVKHRIVEVLDCVPAEARSIAGIADTAALPDLAQVEARMERFRQERERLGGVNLRADEEAAEVGARRDTLVAERDDLISAIHRLRQGIASLNKEGRERLLAAFDTVNGHFTQLFTHLFGGGTAELQFTESEDPLEAGLDILARPPGKKPQSMTLLSGGEQALTALALIFAVFLTNPAPICVLDEVDAPLDDANVERFCNLLEEMTRLTDTRFVAVTHNPITMSRMNRLFGVTMAERGVSQLVSVDLETAERFREAG